MWLCGLERQIDEAEREMELGGLACPLYFLGRIYLGILPTTIDFTSNLGYSANC